MSDSSAAHPVADAASVLEVRGVSKWYGDFQALDGLGFDVRAGTITALLGANGAGKTTLIKIITGLIPCERGTVHSPFAAARGRAWFSYVPEEAGLYERMRVDETILYFARLSGMGRAEVRTAMEPWLVRFGLEAKRRVRTVELSKGNQQKVKLIAALICRPPLLVLDEPFTGLDGTASAQLRQCLTEVRAEGTTILLSSHRLDQMDLLADHLVVIAAGRKVLDATLHDARRLYRQNRIEVTFAGAPPAGALDGLPGVLAVTWDEGAAQLTLAPEAHPKAILAELLRRDVELENFVRHSPDLDEIFHAAYAGPGGGENSKS